jgi:hypothetical protein
MEAAKEKLPEDVSARAHQMPRNTTILYRNKAPKDANASHYRGLLKLEDGDAYWVGLWVRRVGQARVLEIRLVRKRNLNFRKESS